MTEMALLPAFSTHSREPSGETAASKGMLTGTSTVARLMRCDGRCWFVVKSITDTTGKMLVSNRGAGLEELDLMCGR